MTQTISVVSGKGGVGKSTFVANLGVALASAGHPTVILDTDIGLRAQDALLGLENGVVYDLIDVLNGECSLEAALLEVPDAPGLCLLAAAQFARSRSLEPKKLRFLLSQLRETRDFLLIDAPAGLEKGFRNILSSGSDRFILMVTPDNLCVRDAERAAQIMNAKKLDRPMLVVNRLDNALIQSGEMMPARVIADTLDLPLLGEIPDDPAVYRSVLRHRPFLHYDCEARGAILRIAKRLQGDMVAFPNYGTMKIPFWKRIFRQELKEVTPLDCH